MNFRYDMRAGKLTVDYLGAVVCSVTLCGDGLSYVAGCGDSTVRLMDVKSGELLNEYTGHVTGEYETEAAVSSDGSRILSGGIRGDVHVWDMLTGEQLTRLPHGSHVVQSIATHPKETGVLASAAANTVKLWRANDATELLPQTIEIS